MSVLSVFAYHLVPLLHIIDHRWCCCCWWCLLDNRDELCKYYRHIFASKAVMEHPRTKAILGFDKSGTNLGAGACIHV